MRLSSLITDNPNNISVVGDADFEYFLFLQNSSMKNINSVPPEIKISCRTGIPNYKLQVIIVSDLNIPFTYIHSLVKARNSNGCY